MRIHRSNRSEFLLAELTQVVAHPQADPLARECIVVQGRGMERWLALELSNRLGAFANAEFPFPRAFLQRCLNGVLGGDGNTGKAFDPGVLMWSIVDRLPGLAADDRFGSIREYLRDDPKGDKLLQLARRIADHFDHYVVYRPEMVLAWERGERPPGPELPAQEAAWQAELWRALVEQHGSLHLAARIQNFVEILAATPEPWPGLPARVSVFGISTLPPLFMAALSALARVTEVHLFAQSPSREYWGQIRSAREQIRGRWREFSHAEGDEAFLHFEEGHPLLASLGRLGRDFQEILESGVDYQEDEKDLYRDPLEADPQNESMLRVLQSDILNLRDRSLGESGTDEGPRKVVSADRSIAVHACHGPMREAEVLRDQLLDLFEADPSLEARDVIIMTPDVESYAPFVEAAFAGFVDGNDAGRGRIPCHISDRGARSSFELVEAFSQLLDVLTGRLAASEVIDLLGQPAIRDRFGIRERDEPRLREWIEGAGIRWGIDADHRAREGQPPAIENTWCFGLERLLLGYGMADGSGRLHEGVRPFGDIEGGEAQALGRLADFLALIFDFHGRAQTARSLTEWQSLLTELLDRALHDDGETVHQRQWIRDGLRELAEAGEGAGYRGTVTLRGLRDQLDPWIAHRAPPGGFLTGGVTFCELVPMRTIPFRVVCLMGLGETQFPRSRGRLGFDLIGHRPRPGDRSAREDDRYLFLEALLSARDRLIVSYRGFGERDNEAHNPSVVVCELLDHLDRAFAPEDVSGSESSAGWSRERGTGVVVEHPLQPFSPVYFTDSAGDSKLFSYSETASQAARLLGSDPVAPSRFFPEALPTPPREESEESPRIELEELITFFRNPVRSVLRDRLGVQLFDEEEATSNREPMSLDGLEEWRVGDELIDEFLAGQLPDLVETRIRGLGMLPLGVPGECAYQEVADTVKDLLGRVRELCADEARSSIAVDREVSGTRLVGSLDGIGPRGRVDLRFSKVGGSWELGEWIRHLALCLVAPEGIAHETHLLARPNEKGVKQVVFSPIPRAEAELKQLIEIYRRGQLCALPLFPKTSRQYVKTLQGSGTQDPEKHASLEAYRVWRGQESQPAASSRGAKTGGKARPRGERDDAYLRRVFAEQDPLANSWRPLVGHDTDGFRSLAVRVFGPLFEHRRESR